MFQTELEQGSRGVIDDQPTPSRDTADVSPGGGSTLETIARTEQAVRIRLLNARQHAAARVDAARAEAEHILTEAKQAATEAATARLDAGLADARAEAERTITQARLRAGQIRSDAAVRARITALLVAAVLPEPPVETREAESGQHPPGSEPFSHV